MIANQDLMDLVLYDGPELVLSTFLDTDLAAKPRDAVKLDLRHSLKGLATNPSERDIDAVTRYLDYEYMWNSRGLALYVMNGDIWKAIALPKPVPVETYYDKRPYVRPLVEFRDQYGNYVVAVMDRESVRLFSVSAGKISPELDASGEEIKRHKQGGWSAERYQRHEDNIAMHNLKQSIELLESFLAKTGYRHLILAGTDEVLTQVRDLLPIALKKSIIGEFTADMRISPVDILNTTQDLLVKSDQDAENQLVTSTITAAAKGGTGVRGLADTLYTLREGRARQLLVSSCLQAAGYTCKHCHYLAGEPFTACPFCGEKDVQETTDIVNEAILRALQGNVGVNVIRDNPELDREGGIAAVLRY
jgi:peptide subunit release factor 1 (eRF1)